MTLSNSTALIAALGLGMAAVAPVAAQEHVEVHRTVATTTTTTTTNNGAWHADRHSHRVCHTYWRHHHKMKRCTVHRWH